jgi:hypothetical protein
VLLLFSGSHSHKNIQNKRGGFLFSTHTLSRAPKKVEKKKKGRTCIPIKKQNKKKKKKENGIQTIIILSNLSNFIVKARNLRFKSNNFGESCNNGRVYVEGTKKRKSRSKSTARKSAPRTK